MQALFGKISSADIVDFNSEHVAIGLAWGGYMLQALAREKIFK
jgi:hypothetical protein